MHISECSCQIQAAAAAVHSTVQMLGTFCSCDCASCVSAVCMLVQVVVRPCWLCALTCRWSRLLMWSPVHQCSILAAVPSWPQTLGPPSMRHAPHEVECQLTLFSRDGEAESMIHCMLVKKGHLLC
jgi:hypothetical protein